MVPSATVARSAAPAVVDAAPPSPPLEQAGAIHQGNILVTEGSATVAEPISFRVDRRNPRQTVLLDNAAIMSCMRLRRTLAVALFVGLACSSASAIASDVAPHPGATYRGRITETSGSKVLASQRIFFTVDRQGKTVSNFTLRDGYPVYCEPKGIGEVQSTTARVFRSGKFKAKLPIYAKHHQRQGSLIVTGMFARPNLESGTVKTDFTAASRHSCNGSARYKTMSKVK